MHPCLPRVKTKTNLGKYVISFNTQNILYICTAYCPLLINGKKHSYIIQYTVLGADFYSIEYLHKLIGKKSVYTKQAFLTYS